MEELFTCQRITEFLQKLRFILSSTKEEENVHDITSFLKITTTDVNKFDARALEALIVNDDAACQRIILSAKAVLDYLLFQCENNGDRQIHVIITMFESLVESLNVFCNISASMESNTKLLMKNFISTVIEGMSHSDRTSYRMKINVYRLYSTILCQCKTTQFGDLCFLEVHKAARSLMISLAEKAYDDSENMDVLLNYFQILEQLLPYCLSLGNIMNLDLLIEQLFEALSAFNTYPKIVRDILECQKASFRNIICNKQ